MAIVIDTTIDLSTPQQQVRALQQQIGRDLVGGFVRAEDAARRTSDATEELAERLSLSDKVGLVGDLGDAFRYAADSLGIFSEGLVEGVDRVATLTEKGAQIGAVFGPIPALLGGILGGIVSVVGEIARAFDDAEERARRQLVTLEKLLGYTERLKGSVAGLRDLDDATEGIFEGAAEFTRQQERSLRTSLGASSDYLADLKTANRDIDYALGQISAAQAALDRERLAVARAGADAAAGLLSPERARKEAEAAEGRLRLAEETISLYREEIAVKQRLSGEAQADYQAALSAETAALEARTTASKAAAAAARELADLRQAEAKDARGAFDARETFALGAAPEAKEDLFFDVLGASALAANDDLADLAGTAGDLSLDLAGLEGVAEPLAGQLDRIAESAKYGQAALEELAATAKAALGEAFGAASAGLLSAFFDNLQAGAGAFEGIGRAFAEAGAQSLKAAGTQIGADGLTHLAIGTGKLISSGGLLGGTQAAYGLKELATGLALGGGGALLGRAGSLRAGGGRGLSGRASLGDGGGVDGGPRVSTISAAGPVVQGPITVVIQSLVPASQRAAEEAGAAIAQATAAYRRAGGST